MYTTIKEMLQRYFDAFYEVDIKELSKIFHKAARIYGKDENGVLEDLDKETFLGILGTFRPNGENPEFIRSDEILAIDLISDDVAVARIKLRFQDLMCTDILNLVCFDNEWSIVSILDFKEPVS